MDERDIVERLLAVMPYQGKSNVAFLCHDAGHAIRELRHDLTRARESWDTAINVAAGAHKAIWDDLQTALRSLSTTQAELAELRARVVEVGSRILRDEEGTPYEDLVLSENERALSALVKEVESGT